MKKYCLRILQVFILLTYVTGVSAQMNMPADTSYHSSEKIYIHYDKPYYAAGETIWFKCYLYDKGLPSVGSQNLYLQLIDPFGKITEIKKYPLSGATAKGNINLSSALTEGFYTVRAVTPATATNNDLIYAKNIYIYNQAVKIKDTIVPKKISIRFFPESGNLIDSIFTQVGFKATDEKGNPAEVSGVIKSSNDAVIATFRSVQNGIGKFSFKPRLGQKYLAEAEINGKTLTYPLPDVVSTGINLMVADEPEGKVYELARNRKTNMESIQLVVRLNHEIVYENKIFFGKELALRGHLKTNDLPSGILQLTVLSNEGVPLAERLSFVNNVEYKRDAGFEVIRMDTLKRGANKYRIKFPAEIQTSCSISITDAEANIYPDKENIHSGLLLTGDLKGYIYNAAWYFRNTDNKTKEALDNVMMIHGWNRYNITKTSRASQKTGDEYLITVTGIVSDIKTGRAVSKGSLDLGIVSEDSTTQKLKIPVDARGRFVLDSLLIFGEAKLYYRYTSDGGHTKDIIIYPDKRSSDSVSYFQMVPERSLRSNLLPNNIYQQKAFTILPVEKIKQLQEVVVVKKGDRAGDKMNETYSSGMFRSSGKIVLDNINHPYNEASLSVVDYIKTNINSILLSGGAFVNRKNFSLGSGGMWRVETLLNEAPASVANLASIRMKDVALIKFYEAGFAGVGSGAPGGAVAVYLKKNDDDAPTKPGDNNIKYFSVHGYSVTQEFYNPDYSTPDPRHSLPDKRITLYWNPDANTSAEIPAININFYNNDISKKFMLILQGLDNTGKLIHFEKVIGN